MRIAGVTIPDDKQLAYALPLIYGIGPARARDILAKAGVPVAKKGSELSAEEEQKVRSLVADASHYGVSESSVRQALVRAGFITA